MGADHPIIVSRENQQEADSIAAVQHALRPWRVTPVDGRDDVGRDGFCQINDPLADGTGRARATPVTFNFQIRSHADRFSHCHVERISTRHLNLWSARNAVCTVLFIYSAASDSIRWRTARDLRREVDLLRAGWLDQDTVSVEFREEHALEELDRLLRSVNDESDWDGGVSEFHVTRRRVVLTDIFVDGANTGTTFALRRGSPSGSEDGYLYVGSGWMANDIAPADVDGLVALAGASLLYEELWVPLTQATNTIRLLGRPLLEDLITKGRLHFWTVPGTVGFVFSKDRLQGDRWGTFVTLSSPQRSPGDDLAEWVERIAKEHGDPSISPLILRAIRELPGGNARALAIIRESEVDLAKSTIRHLLGISTHPTKIPFWDAPLANRVLHLNSAMAIADELRADVVEYEGGLSRLAAEKFSSNLRFDRLYQTASSLDAALALGGMPDVASLVRRVGREPFFAATGTAAAQGFRDWFWESASSFVGSGADITSQFTNALSGIIPVEAHAFSVLDKLRLRFIQQTEGLAIMGAPFTSRPVLGFAARATRGEALLRKQALNHFERRRQAIRELLGVEPSSYQLCPCRSGEKYKFCCGRRPS